MRPANTGLWTPLPDDDDPGDDPADGVHDHRISVLTIMPSVDIDTDSDNTGAIDRSDWEEEIENHANWLGAIILLNNDDDNSNDTSDMDEVDQFGQPIVYTGSDDDLRQVILDFGLAGYQGLDGCTLQLTSSDGLRIWGDQRRNLPAGTSVCNLAHTLYVWSITSSTSSGPFPPSVYVEGIATGRQWVTWELSGSSGQVLASDTVVFTVIDFGLASVDLEATDAARTHDITRDTGGVYDDVEWVDPSPDGTLQGAPDDHRLPVCYTRSGPHGAVHVRVEQVDIRLLGNLGVTSVIVRANGTIGGQAITLPETAATISGDQIVALNLDSPEAIPDVIRNTEIVLNWQVSLDGGPALDVGSSVNTAYITWDDPLAAAPFETCLYVGCQAADGMSTTHTEQQVVAKVFSDGFAGLNVRRVDGTILKYWDGGNTRATDTAGLLADANGQYGAWAEFFVDTLRSQGIGGADKIGVYAASNPGNDGFLVKSWSFIGSRSLPGTSPYSWVVGTDVVDNAGVPGQGNPNPPGAFFNHFIVRFGGRYYDPSYGGPGYATQWEWEDASLDGFFTIIGGVALEKPNDLGPANVETLFVVI